MIVLHCSRCDKEIETSEPLANQSVLCPHCGQLLAKGSGVRSKNLEDHGGEATLAPGQGPAADTDSDDLAFLKPKQEADELGRLSHYRVLKLLGKGGMAMVFMAEDTVLERTVALKVMRPEMARADLAAQRFMREAQIMARLHNDHVVTIFEVGREGACPFLAMELLRGEPLDLWLANNRPSFDRVLQMGLQIARGLAAAHQAGLIHRDIKPANIWVEEPAGRIKVLDFGLARPVRDSGVLTHAGAVVGTPAYMAPEQAEGESVDERSDLFGLGCVLYEMSSGKQAFVGTSAVGVLRAVALTEPAPLLSIAPDVPAAFSDLVRQLMSKDPAARPSSAAAVVDALEAIAAGKAPAVRKASAPAPLPDRRARFLRPAWLVAAITGLAILLVLGLVFRPRSSPSESKESRPARAVFRGVTDSEIVLGMSAPFSGPSRELGREMELGIRTHLDQINAQGGIAGRTIRLVALDDGYEPGRAEANMRELFEKHQVFAIVGNVGTPTAEKTVPYALDKQMVFFGAFTGAPLLRRDPPDRFVFNYRASYEEETAAIVKYLVEVKKLRPEQIAVFAQNDGYGDAGFRGVSKVLRKYGRDPEQILRVGYERNTSNVDAAVEKFLKATNLRAVIMVATYKPAALFIRKIKDAGRDVLFANVSFVGSNPLAEELREAGPKYASGVMVTQVVPYPQSEASAVRSFREVLGRYRPNEKPGFVSLEGYLVGLVLTEGLRRAGDNLTTDTFIEALESIRNLDLGIGATLNFGPSEHQASRKVWGTVLDQKGQYQVLELD
jgi:eukaryotic-like serine/threonine-protein kinase